MTVETIEYRLHHIQQDIIEMENIHGYNETQDEVIKKLVMEFQHNPDIRVIPIQNTVGKDPVCACCPKNKEGTCEEDGDAYDYVTIKKYPDIEVGESYTVPELQKLEKAW